MDSILDDIPELPPEELAMLKEYRRRGNVAKLAERYKKSLFEFTLAAWHVLEPSTPLIMNWHIKAICEAIQAVLEDWSDIRVGISKRARMQNLLINIPPGTMKSRILCVMAPCWMWLKHPEWRCIVFSGNESISSRDSVYRRDLLESEWYQDTFKPSWRLKDDQNAKLNYTNTKGGFHQAKTAGQRVTGDRADALFVDDPNDAQTVGSEEVRKKINELWWDAGAANRLNDPKHSIRIGIMQRLHEDDWAGHVLAQKTRNNGKPVWWHLNLPQEFEPGTKCPCGRDICQLPIGNLDPRTEPGELLFPERFPREVLDEELERLTESGYAGQHQQRPFPKGGGTIKRTWFRYYSTDPQDMQFDTMFQSWDLSFKKTKKSDFVCGQVWGIRGTRRYLLDQYHKRADLPDTIKAIRDMSEKWPAAIAKYIEDKANGSGVIASLRNELVGLIAVNPQGGKESRASAVAPLIEGGSVYLPNPQNEPWVEGLLAECEAFPNGLHDDRVDAMTQGLNKTINMKFEHIEDNRTTPEKLWDDIAEDERAKKQSLRFEDDSMFGPSIDATPEEWTFDPPF